MAADFVGRRAVGRVDFVKKADVVSRAESQFFLGVRPPSVSPLAEGHPADAVGRHSIYARMRSQNLWASPLRPRCIR
jgi:hypothetical protein